MKLRVCKKPIINFDCADYTNMIDMNGNSNIFEPPFSVSIPYEHLEQFLKNDEPSLPDPKIPLHIQATERHVQLL